jgi:Uma2 family endonuclease
MTTTERVFVPLESGDRLTREEFHRRYCARPDIRKAELVEGVVYVASPARAGQHGTPANLVRFWLSAYAMVNPAIEVADDSTVFLSETSEVQPDVCLYWKSGTGEGVRLTETGYLEGAPPLVAEVAASSASYDLHDKKDAYRRAGVAEYIVWRVLDKQVDWFRLDGGEYVPIEPNRDGVLESVRFPGLRLSVPALLAGDRAGLLAVLQRRRERRTGD